MSTETTNANAWPALVRSTESGDFFRAPLAATLQGLGALGAAPVLLLLMKAMGDEAEPAPALFMAVACAGAAFFASQVLFGRARRILEAQPVRFSVVPAIRECVRGLAEAGFVWSMVLSTAGLLAVLWTAGDDLEQKLPAAFGASIVIGVGGWLSLLFAHLFTELASALVEIANNTAGGWAARVAAPQSVVAEPVAASAALQGVADPASTHWDEGALSFGTEPKRDATAAKLGFAAVGVVVVVGGLFWMGGGESGGGESGGSDFQSPTLGAMKSIPAGTFTMGSAISPSGPANRSGDDAQAMEDLDRALAGASGAQQANGANLGQARSGGLGTKRRGSGSSDYSTAIGTVGGDPIILGALDKALIDAVIKRNMNAIRGCYFTELTKNPTLGGKITEKIVIAKDGTVSSATTGSSTMGNPAVESCINGRFQKFQFPEPKGGGIVIVKYPFLFAPS